MAIHTWTSHPYADVGAPIAAGSHQFFFPVNEHATFLTWRLTELHFSNERSGRVLVASQTSLWPCKCRFLKVCARINQLVHNRFSSHFILSRWPLLGSLTLCGGGATNT